MNSPAIYLKEFNELEVLLQQKFPHYKDSNFASMLLNLEKTKSLSLGILVTLKKLLSERNKISNSNTMLVKKLDPEILNLIRNIKNEMIKI